MKKIIFNVKSGALMCCMFLLTAFSANAQTLSIGGTNALSVNVTSAGNPATYTYNVTIPYFANELTGTFTVTQGTTNVPYTCGATYFKELIVTNANGYVNSTTNSNTVTIPGPKPVGTSYYTVNAWCRNSAVDLPSIHKGTYNIRIVVTKETAPAVNLNFAPFCKYTPNTNPPQYSGFIGFNVTGNYANAGKLYLRVTNPLNTCPTADYKVTLLHGSGAATATIATANFYNCAANTTYTIQLVYKGTSTSGAAITYVVNSGEIGWTDYSWKKGFRNCLNLAEPQPQDPVLVGKATENMMLDTAGSKKYNVYPNPTNSDLNITPADGKEIRSAKVIDPSGFVYESRAFRNGKGEQSINLSHLKPGIYFVEIETNEGVFVEKVVKN